MSLRDTFKSIFIYEVWILEKVLNRSELPEISARLLS